MTRAAVAAALLPLIISGVAAGPAALSASAAPAPPSAPGGLAVTRATSDPHDLAISWKPVSGISNYMVRVNDGAQDTNLIVAPDQTSTVFHGQGDCTTYRVSVSAVVSKDSMGTSAATLVPALGPGAVSRVHVARTESGQSAVVTWEAPQRPGATPVSGYQVQVKQLSSGEVITSGEQSEPGLTLGGLDPNRMYVARVTAVNSYGGCVTSKLLLGNERPSSPSFTVSRPPAQPAAATVTWKGVDWAGYGGITGYSIGYKRVTDKSFTWVPAGPAARTATIAALDPTVTWTFVMRAVNGPVDGLLSKTYVLNRSGYMPIAAGVTITGGQDTITVDFSSPVGSATNYPNARVEVARANGTAGWSDRHRVTNNAGRVTFNPVPCGTYTVVVTGEGTASAQELVRMNARVCQQAPICFVSTLGNGDFEAPVIPNATYRILPSSTAGLTWSNSAENVVELWSTGYSNNSGGQVTAAQGRQFAELNANKAGTLYQDLPTTPGTSMRWYLKHRGRAGSDTMRVMIGAPGGTLTQSGPELTTGNGAWVQYTGTYTIPAGQTTTRFAFQAVRTASSISVGNFLDDVVFTPEACQ